MCSKCVTVYSDPLSVCKIVTHKQLMSIPISSEKYFYHNFSYYYTGILKIMVLGSATIA